MRSKKRRVGEPVRTLQVDTDMGYGGDLRFEVGIALMKFFVYKTDTLIPIIRPDGVKILKDRFKKCLIGSLETKMESDHAVPIADESAGRLYEEFRKLNENLLSQFALTSRA